MPENEQRNRSIISKPRFVSALSYIYIINTIFYMDYHIIDYILLISLYEIKL